MNSKVKRRVAVFTGSRSEYGLQYPICALAGDDRFEYFLLAGGAHLEKDAGKTVAEIESDGFRVHRLVDIRMENDSLHSTASAIGSGIVRLSAVLNELQPDFLVVYGDRFESFAALIAGTQMNVPTAHLEGGDYTEGGALDDSVRHAMTKLAHLHFTTNEQAAARVRGLGEEPWRVFVVGFPALDLVASGEFAPPDQVARELSLDLSRPVILFCQHSITTECDSAAEQIQPSLSVLRSLAQAGCQVIVTYPNNDAGGRRIVDEIQRLAAESLDNVRIVRSLGRFRFHGVLNAIGRAGRGAIVGNSSAGIKESLAFGCPVVNIGTRQQGRLRGANVLDVPYEVGAIRAAIKRCLDDEPFRKQCADSENPYGTGNAGARVAEVLATIPLDAALLRKKMTY